MDDPIVSIENPRFEVDQNPALEDVARQFAKAFGYTADLEVAPALAQLLRLRVSQVNSCTYCLNLHYEVARNLGIHRGKIDTLTACWETDLLEPSEQTALAYTEALTRIADTTVEDRFEPYHRELAAHVSESEVVEIAGIVINMNVWTLLKLAQGATPTLDQI